MDLRPTPAEVDLADRARAAFAAGGAAPSSTGSLGELVAVARELGRAAVPSRFHVDVLVGLLGWGAGGVPTVATEVHERSGTVVASTVPGARGADAVLVCLDDERLVAVDPAAAAVELVDQPTLADPTTCRLSMPSDVAWGAAQAAPVGTARARAAVVLAADAVGAAQAALDAAVAHVSTRHQHGRRLGELQAVRHRCADMAMEVRLATDAVLDAAGVADRGEPEEVVRLAAAHAKAAVPRCIEVTAGAHQLAGGQGVLADAPFHRWYRRARAAEPVLGSTRARHAEIARAALAARRP